MVRQSQLFIFNESTVISATMPPMCHMRSQAKPSTNPQSPAEQRLPLKTISIAFAMPTLSGYTRLKSMECHAVDPKFLQVTNCIIKPIRRNIKDVHVVLKLLQGPVTNASVRLELKQRGYNKPVLYGFTVDACRFLDANNRNTLANVFYNFLKFNVYTNMNHSCPFSDSIIIDHLRHDEKFSLPLPLSMGDYKLMTYWYAYNVLRVTIHVNIETVA
ncbi:uncharacterized protein LOC111593965 [Drosophila hydei]|uniref:Uncharacterized protein LOC111593965 n=1 Tax=Drosophila hydei TaxID=7224 RepID=A0A6J1LEH2_DROHY|nr:uncharacterized protein LOC111593965 [Drosophila hydei]